MDEQCLVAVREAECPAAPRNETLKPASARIGAIEAKTKIAGAARVNRHVLRGNLAPRRRELRIGGEHQQPRMRSRRDPRRNLAAASARGGDDVGACDSISGGVRAAAIHHDDLWSLADRSQSER